MQETQLIAALERAWTRSDRLFAMLPEHARLDRPIGLRHPFLFYVGHLPAFLWNQLSGLCGVPCVNPELDALFERGIDPLSDEGAAASSIAQWPPWEEVLAYRDRVRAWARERAIDVVRGAEGPLAEGFRVLHLVLEHELMHHETLLYMLQEQPLHRKRQGDLPGPVTGPPPARLPPRLIPAGTARIGADWDAIPFGWDNEFPALDVEVDAFTLDALPVTVADYRGYVEASGAALPQGWTQGPDGLTVRSLFAEVPIDEVGGWPAQVSHAEATAYARWAGGRLPSEVELHRAAYGDDGRPYPWGWDEPAEAHGVFDFNLWSPEPVGRRPAGASPYGVQELVGNGWEWSRTPFRPLPGFVAWASTYPGYSADFFDDAHFVVFGGSWATDRAFLRRSFRNWYQGHYPFVFSSFRVARAASGRVPPQPGETAS